MKRRLCFMLLTVFTLVLISSCGSNLSGLFKDPFLAYMRNEGYIEEKDGDITPIVMPSGTEIHLDPFAPSGVFPKDKQGAHAVLNVYFKSEDSYSWVINHSIDEKKQDLAYLGEFAIKYANANGWNNNYDLYISVDGLYAYCTYVYNYETDALYISSYEDMWIDAYQTCGTWHIFQLEDTPEGQKWLINHNLGEIKHGKFENIHNYSKEESYNIRVYEGEFDEFAKDHSDRY